MRHGRRESTGSSAAGLDGSFKPGSAVRSVTRFIGFNEKNKNSMAIYTSSTASQLSSTEHGGQAGDEDSQAEGGRYAHAVEAFDGCAVNKLKSAAYMGAARELCGKGAIKGTKEVVGRLRELAIREVVGRLRELAIREVVGRLRELAIRIGEGAAFNGLLFEALARALREGVARDKDWDRKSTRLVSFYLRNMGDTEGRITIATAANIRMSSLFKVVEVMRAPAQVTPKGDTEEGRVAPEGDTEGRVAPEGDTEGRVATSGHWRGRGITMRRLLDAVEAVEIETHHAFVPRRGTRRELRARFCWRVVAYQTMAALCAAAARWGGGGGAPPPAGTEPPDEQLAARAQELLRAALAKPLDDYHRVVVAADSGGSGGGGDTRAKGGAWLGGGRKAHRGEAEVKEHLLLSRVVLSAVRRSAALRRRASLLPRVLEACRSPNAVTARHAFAVLLEQAASAVAARHAFAVLLEHAASAAAARDAIAVLLEQAAVSMVLAEAVTARHAFGVLLEQAAMDPKAVAEGVYPLLQPTTVAAAGALEIHNQPNLEDPLACVYYLRVLKTLVFAPELEAQSRLDFYRTIANSVSDTRHRVALEASDVFNLNFNPVPHTVAGATAVGSLTAQSWNYRGTAAMQCLMDHERAWTLLVDAQRESRDADLFRRVVDALRRCLAAAAGVDLLPGAAAAAPPGTPGSAPVTPAGGTGGGGGSGGPRSGGAASGGGASGGASGGARSIGGGGSSAAAWAAAAAAPGAPHWPLAHAACRAARAVGQTLQKAISFETMAARAAAAAAADGGGGGGGAPRGGGGGSEAVFFGAGSPSGRLPVSPRSGGSPLSPLLDLPSTPHSVAALLDLPSTPSTYNSPHITTADAAEASNMAAIRDLCRAISGHGFLDCPHRHAMFLLVPDPSHRDPELQEMWAEVQMKMEACPASLPEASLGAPHGGVPASLSEASLVHLVTSLMARMEACPASLPEASLVHLVTSLMARVECSEASRGAIVPAALAIAESFVRQVPTDAVGRALVQPFVRQVPTDAVGRALVQRIVPAAAIAIAESCVRRVPTGAVGRAPVQAWMQCLTYGPQCREVVLQSVYRTLDAPLPEAARQPIRLPGGAGGGGGGDWLGASDAPQLRRRMSLGGAHRRRNSGSHQRRNSGSSGADAEVCMCAVGPRERRRCAAAPSLPVPRLDAVAANRKPLHKCNSHTAMVALRPAIGVYAADMTHERCAAAHARATPLLRRRPSSGANDAIAALLSSNADDRRGGGRGAEDPDALAQARGAARRLQRLALWFVGEYCCELVGLPPPRRHQVVPPLGATPLSPGDALLKLSVPGPLGSSKDDPCGWQQDPPAASAAAAATAVVQHPVTGAMSAAAAALLMRLRAAAVFEDAHTRHAAVSALCFVALRLPEPARFDAYLFLRGLVACEFDIADPAPYCGGAGPAGGLRGYVEAQAAACAALEDAPAFGLADDAPAFGLADVARPVLAYLDMLYAARAGGGGAAAAHAAAPALQDLRAVLDPAAFL
ncbi:hypothetical protein JKP88DRAFT_303007 [Tribonema minus]|uniref:Uncharacterized protein n=1 Tax=Tribonema minus TaxID=303371 RepID=A0A835Z8W3_9STRA|nr:hypothetical protein JKP88DRAFT_303007 [Tribonema minus]